jgi:hypothetical protein
MILRLRPLSYHHFTIALSLDCLETNDIYSAPPRGDLVPIALGRVSIVPYLIVQG